jgi:DNA-binding response OmpR family regulator
MYSLPDHRPDHALLFDGDSVRADEYAKDLKTAGYQVARATNLTAALALARQSPPDIIFLHAGSTGSEGVSFLSQLRSDDSTRHIRVHMVMRSSRSPLQRQRLIGVRDDS